MKQVTPAACAFVLLCIFLSSCGHGHRHSLNFSVSESDKTYKIRADFDERKTRSVEKYLDKELGSRNNMSFINTRIDGDLTLDDRTTFYIRKAPGALEIVFDKRKNSMRSYDEMKQMAAGLKSVLQD